MREGPIGIFDSGYGGLTVLKEIARKLPEYDYLYFGDNARTPYGSRSFQSIYEYTLECVNYLFEQGCPLIILACNTASAKALRTIQQKDLPSIDPNKRVLGVIRPTAEVIGNYTQTKKIGVLGTSGTINSGSYLMEIKKLYPDISVYQQPCPMWVPLVEYSEYEHEGSDYFVKKYLDELFKKNTEIDAILLACTHYPLLIKKIQEFIPGHISLINQGEIVAASLADYLKRHEKIETNCTKNNSLRFLTTDSTDNFDLHGKIFFGKEIKSEFVHL